MFWCNTATGSGDDFSKYVTADYLTAQSRKSLAVSFDREFKNAGTYTATATMKTPDSNHTLTNATREVTIARATRSTITMGEPYTINVTSVTLASVTPYDEDGPVTYGYSTTSDINDVSNWQDSRTFTGLTSGTTYYFFAKTAQGTNYLAAQSSALTVKTLDKSLTGIAVTTPPTKTNYKTNETFDTSGMVVTATYDDGTTAAVDAADYMVSYPDSRTSFLVSDTAVTITHDGKETTQVVTVTRAAGSGSVTLADWTYGDTANVPVPESTTNGIDSVSYRYKGKDAEDETYSSNTPTDAGTYAVKAEFTATDQYTAPTATADFTIASKARTVKIADGLAISKTYDSTTVVESADVASGLVVEGALPGETITASGTFAYANAARATCGCTGQVEAPSSSLCSTNTSQTAKQRIRRPFCRGLRVICTPMATRATIR